MELIAQKNNILATILDTWRQMFEMMSTMYQKNIITTWNVAAQKRTTETVQQCF